VTSEEQAQAMNACLDEVITIFRDNYAECHEGRTEAEARLYVSQYFINRAYTDLALGAGTSVVANYATYGAALLRILDLQEQVAMRDSVIQSLWDIEEMP
jgi:hypothetical protein